MRKTDEIAIRVENVNKTFKLPHEKLNSIKGLFVSMFHGKRTYEKQNVLKDVSFEIKKGEFFGIVGRNGSGKSTLLKLIAGIYTPDSGHIQVNGKLTPFIELGVGFNPELTGRENVFLNGALLGFNRKEMEAMYDEIVEFAELERFMDQKLKNYSSGMQVRLAFSIAIRANTAILLLDEVLAVGDEAFQRKCFSYFAKLRKEKKTVVLVTHDMGSVQRFCTNAMLIDNGRVLHKGNVETVTRKYQELNRPPEEESGKIIQNIKNANKDVYGSIKTRIVKNGKIERIYGPSDSRLYVENVINPTKDIKDAFFGFTIWKENGEPVYWYTTEPPHKTIGHLRANKPLKIMLEIQNIFGDGKYTLSVSVKSYDRSKEFIISDEIERFQITGYGKNGWMLHPNVKVEIL